MLDGYKFRAYPEKAQEQTFLRWAGCQRLVYNCKVQEDRYFRKFQRFLGMTGIPVPVDQTYSQFISEATAFLREVPSQVLRNGAVLWRQAYSRFFKGLGGRPKFKTGAGRRFLWLTNELFDFIPKIDPKTGEITGYRLVVGTPKFPVGELVYEAHRMHVIPSSIHVSVEGSQWFVSFAAENPDLLVSDSDAGQERIAEDLRHLTEEQRMLTLGNDRGVAKPLAASDGRVYGLSDVQKERVEKARRQKARWQRIAAGRKKKSQNQKKAYRRAARYLRYETNVRYDYAHKTSHDLVATENVNPIVFEDLKVKNMTRRPRAKQDENGKWLKNGARAKAGLNRSILASAWGRVVTFTRYKAPRAGKIVVMVPPAYSSHRVRRLRLHSQGQPAITGRVLLPALWTPGQRRSQCRRGHHPPGSQKVLSGEPLGKPRRSTGIFRKPGPERSEVTPGETVQDTGGQKPAARWSMSQEPPEAIPETHTSTCKAG